MKTATLTELTKRTFFEMMKDVATSIPGHVIAFDSATQLAQIQIGIVKKDINGVSFSPPPLIEVMVHFTGGDYSVEFQVDPGNEGFILFSQRCIDGWMNTGGIAENPIMRFHDMSDAAFLPGIRSQPNALGNFKNNGIRLRNKDGSQHVWLKNDGSIIADNGSGSFEITSSGAFSGNFTDFNVTSNSFTHNGVNVGDVHNHEPGDYIAGSTPVTNNSGDPV